MFADHLLSLPSMHGAIDADDCVQVAASLEAAAVRRDPVLLLAPDGVAPRVIAHRAAMLLGPLPEQHRRWLKIEHDIYTRALGAEGPLDRPLRAPHYTISRAGMAGDWHDVHPIGCHSIKTPRCVCNGELHRVQRIGETRMARFGVLYLDRLHEWPTPPLASIPPVCADMGDTRPWVIASAFLCPCGMRGMRKRATFCRCTPEQILAHGQRVRRNALLLGAITEIVVGDAS